MAISYMTQEGYDKKMAELNRLENVERPDVVKAIQEAREKGDLSENAEYIDQSKLQTDEVQLMNKVTIKNIKNNAKMTYTIVSETEADLKAGKISITTPIAKGLLGHKKGDVVDVKVPAGTMKFEIIDIGL